jgi:hypothetical protein
MDLRCPVVADDARKRQFDAIVVWRFDRFARSTKHLLTALEEFRSLGIQFISYQENIDRSSALGQALFTIVSAVAQLERDLIWETRECGDSECASEWKAPWASACQSKLGRNSSTKGGRPLLAKDCCQTGDWRRDRPGSAQGPARKTPRERPQLTPLHKDT